MSILSNPQSTVSANKLEQTPDNLVEYMAAASQERVDAEFEKKVTRDPSFNAQLREAALIRERDNLDRAYGQPTAEQVAQMIKEITNYLVQEADLIEGYRTEAAETK